MSPVSPQAPTLHLPPQADPGPPELQYLQPRRACQGEGRNPCPPATRTPVPLQYNFCTCTLPSFRKDLKYLSEILFFKKLFVTCLSQKHNCLRKFEKGFKKVINKTTVNILVSTPSSPYNIFVRDLLRYNSIPYYSPT